MNIIELEKKAAWVRRQTLETIVLARKGHIGGAFSCTDILVALYYGDVLRFDPQDPDWSDRDRFILSKGHSCLSLYVVLADLAFFSRSELNSMCQKGSMLGAHPDRHIPGIEADTGSLGHGLGIGTGLALSAKLDEKDFMTIVMLGDGECYEGSVWEAALFASHCQLNNLVAIVDRNYQSAIDFTEDCNKLDPLEDKWRSFGWDVLSIDGHSFMQICDAFKDFRTRASTRPLVIVANTVKGEGVSFMEGALKWHHGVPSGEELNIARSELAERKYDAL